MLNKLISFIRPQAQPDPTANMSPLEKRLYQNWTAGNNGQVRLGSRTLVGFRSDGKPIVNDQTYNVSWNEYKTGRGLDKEIEESQRTVDRNRTEYNAWRRARGQSEHPAPASDGVPVASNNGAAPKTTRVAEPKTDAATKRIRHEARVATNRSASSKPAVIKAAGHKRSLHSGTQVVQNNIFHQPV